MDLQEVPQEVLGVLAQRPREDRTAIVDDPNTGERWYFARTHGAWRCTGRCELDADEGVAGDTPKEEQGDELEALLERCVKVRAVPAGPEVGDTYVTNGDVMELLNDVGNDDAFWTWWRKWRHQDVEASRRAHQRLAEWRRAQRHC